MWKLLDKQFSSRLILGTSRYPSPQTMKDSILESKTNLVTVALRRQSPTKKGGKNFWEIIQSCPVEVLPNTAGCRSVKEAVATAHLARELFGTQWIKLEVIGDEQHLQPDPYGLVEAAAILVKDGFEVLPYSNDDLIVAERLLDVGCKVIMPWGAPIGSGRGLQNRFALKTLRARFPTTPLIVDAGLGAPSHAAEAMEMGFDGVLLNTAVALAQDPVSMAKAFAIAIESGRMAYQAGLMPQHESASPSTPVVGTPFWAQE